MNKKLTKQVKKSYMIFAAALILLAVALLVMTRFRIISLIKGPENITSASLSNFEGNYVEMNVTEPIDYYEYTDNSISYIIYNEDYDFYYGIEFPEYMESDVDEVLEANSATPMDGQTSKPKSMTVKGTLHKLKGNSKENFEFGVPFATRSEDAKNKLHGSYYIEYNTLDGMSVPYIIIVTAVSLALIIAAVISIVIMFAGNHVKGIDSFISSHDAWDEKSLEAEFKTSRKISKRIYVTDKLTFIVIGIKIHIIDHSECERISDTLKKITLLHKFTYVMKNGKKKSYSFTKKEIKNINKRYKELNCSFND